MSFDWTKAIFSSLRDRVENGSVEILTTDIVKREVRRQIFMVRNELQQTIRKLNSKSGILNKHFFKNGEKNIFQSSERDLPSADKIFENCEIFFKELKYIELSSTFPSMGNLFDLYFEGKPPFDGNNKKAEFPDAGNLLILLDYARRQRRKIHIVSGDNDWKSICEENNELIYCEQIEKFISVAIDFEFDYGHALEFLNKSYLFDWINSDIDRIRMEIFEMIHDNSFVNYGNGEIKNLEFDKFNIISALIFDVTNHQHSMDADVELYFELRYDADISIYDAAFDNEMTQQLNGYAEMAATLELDIVKDGDQLELGGIRVDHTDGLALEFDLRSTDMSF